MTATQSKVEYEFELLSKITKTAPEVIEKLNTHKVNTSAVRAWRLNIKRNIERLEVHENASEDELIALNESISAVNGEEEIVLKLVNAEEVKAYIDNMTAQETELKSLMRKVQGIKAKNRNVVLGTISARLKVIEKNVAQANEWLETNGNVNTQEYEAQIEVLNNAVKKLNSEVG